MAGFILSSKLGEPTRAAPNTVHRVYHAPLCAIHEILPASGRQYDEVDGKNSSLALRKCELHGHPRLTWSTLAIPRLRLVAPLFDRADSGLREERISGDDCDGAHRAIAEHLDIEHDQALNMASLGFSGIFRLYPVNERTR